MSDEPLIVLESAARSWPELCYAAGLASSRSEARRLIKQGALHADDERVHEASTVPPPDTTVTLRKGRRIERPVRIASVVPRYEDNDAA